MINGFEYGFEDVEMVVNGYPLIGFVEFEYGVTKAHTNIHGRKNVPVAMGRGKKDAAPGRIVILQSEFEAMNAAAPAGTDPTDWNPFDVVVSYAPVGGVITTDIVPMCRVNAWKKGMKTDDDHQTIELGLTTGIPLLNV